MGDQQMDERELDRFLNDVPTGQAAAGHYDLAPEVIDLMHSMRLLADAPLPAPTRDRVGPAIGEEIAQLESAQSGDASARRSGQFVVDPRHFVPNGHAGSRLRRVPLLTIPAGGQRLPWAFAQLATAALLLITLGSVYLAFLHQRTGEDGPTVVRPFASTVNESLLDVVADATPSGNTAVAVALWSFRPGPLPLTLVASAGPKYVVADTGSFVVAIEGDEHTLAAGDHLQVPPGSEIVLRNAGTRDATAFVVYVVPNNEAMWWDWTADPTQITRGLPIYSNTDAFPSAPTHLSLERLTLSPGEALPTYETSRFEWIGIVAGRLGLALAGDRLPYRWESGQEQLFVGEQAVPKLQDGWQMTLRNAGDEPLVLVRLRVTPAGHAGAPTVQASPSAAN
ncbi:MAG: hypothetical protein QOJ59_3751 [Thermomicrobiales bacterium]|nr:hypothetical protein [Thermomicrobiales bacterium]